MFAGVLLWRIIFFFFYSCHLTYSDISSYTASLHLKLTSLFPFLYHHRTNRELSRQLTTLAEHHLRALHPIPPGPEPTTSGWSISRPFLVHR